MVAKFHYSRCYKWNIVSDDQAQAKNGINVCYGRHTGYGGYGNLARGGRQILLRQETLEKEAYTWIRLEDGLVPENVTLNATYGQDEYHPLQRYNELKRSEFEGAANGIQILPGLYSVAIFLFLITRLPLRVWG